MKVALVGKMRSGKDTVGRYFVDNEECVQVAFGDGIKQVARVYFPHIVAKGKPRRLYQRIGQVFREFDPYVWVNVLDRTVTNHMEDGEQHFVVTDVRQMNEYIYLKANGYTIIKVETAEELRLERIKASGDEYTEEDLNHETELAVDGIPYDYLIDNNTTIEDLYQQIRFVIKEIKEEQR